MRLAFIVKSNVRKSKFYENVEALRNKKIADTIEVFETEYAGHAIELARKAAEEGFDHVVAVGGDGTLHEVVNGLLSTNRDADDLPAVGVLPYGSANDFSKCLGITDDINILGEWASKNKTGYIDIGEVTFNDEDGHPHSRFFINILDAGIGAQVVKKVNNSQKRLGAKIAFLKATTEVFLTYSPSEVNARIDGKEIKAKLLTLVVANGNYFGNGLCIAPDAKPDDNSFQVVLLADISVSDYLFNLRKLKKKERLKHRKIQYLKGRIIEIMPENYSVSIEADGEFLGYAPMKTQIVHNRIRFLVDRPEENVTH